jgi:hypothetical protein
VGTQIVFQLTVGSEHIQEDGDTMSPGDAACSDEEVLDSPDNTTEKPKKRKNTSKKGVLREEIQSLNAISQGTAPVKPGIEKCKAPMEER